MPDSAWLMTQSWHDLLFAHWPVDPIALRRLVPEVFELDLFEKRAWLGVVPFRMTNVGMRGVPSLPWLSAFPELNVRTYVRGGGRPGVYFFSLDAARWPAVQAANVSLNLPYYWADMTIERTGQDIHYASKRRTGDAEFRARYAPTGEPFFATPGSIEHFLTERYGLFHQHRNGQPYRLDIHHAPWALQTARVEIAANTIATSLVRPLAPVPPILHFARRQDVVSWLPTTLR